MLIQYIKKQRKQLVVIILSLITTGFFLGYSRGDFTWTIMDQLEDNVYDLKVKVTASNEIDDRIVIIDIDEKSLAEVERWPWGRDKIASLVNQLFDYYFVAIIGFDIYFREPDESSGIRVLERLAVDDFSDIPEYQSKIVELSKDLDYDQMFVDSMLKGPAVLGYTFFTEGEAFSDLQGGVLPPAVLTADIFEDKNVHAPKASGYGVNLLKIQQAAVATGHTNRGLDEDGIARRVHMLMEYGGNYYEALSLAIARYMLVVDDIEPVYAYEDIEENQEINEIEGLRIGDHLIPVNVNLQALIPYREPGISYR